jgi:aminoglycoside phosphotransferase (APT) family kinase protein
VESKTKNPKTRSQIAVMAAKAFGGMQLAAGDDAVRELKQGWFNAAYTVQLADGREVILKIAPPQGAEVLQYEQNIMATEVAAMRLVRRNPSIPVPAIYFYDDAHDVCDSDYFFMEKIVGENLEQVKASLPAETQAAVERQIGAIIREINGFGGAYFGLDGNPNLRASTWREAFTRLVEAVLDDSARKSVVFDDGYDELRAVVLRHAPALDVVVTPCLVHWDAWDPNFFVQDGRVVGIIDFERAMWAEPLMEAQFRPLFGAGVNNSMRGYGKTTFTFEEEQRCHLYSLYLALVMHVECFYRNYDTDAIYNLSRQFIGATMGWLKAN